MSLTCTFLQQYILGTLFLTNISNRRRSCGYLRYGTRNLGSGCVTVLCIESQFLSCDDFICRVLINTLKSLGEGETVYESSRATGNVRPSFKWLTEPGHSHFSMFGPKI